MQGVTTHDSTSRALAAPQSWPPVFPQTTPATLYMGLVYMDKLNKCKLPSDDLLQYYWQQVFPLHFQSVDPDFADPRNFDVSVTDIKCAWPQMIKVHVFNKTGVPGRVAPKNIQYLLYVEYGTDKIHVKKTTFVRSHVLQNFTPPPVDGLAALSVAPAPAPVSQLAPKPAPRLPTSISQMRTENARETSARVDAEDLLALSYSVGNDGPREEEG